MSRTGFISEQLCIKVIVVVADAEEKRGRLYGKGIHFQKLHFGASAMWTTVSNIMMMEQKTSY